MIGFKTRFVIVEILFLLLVIYLVPIGAHGTVVTVTVANMLVVAWFWYNHVRTVEVTTDGNLRFWIGNIEIDVPFDKVVAIRRVATPSAYCSFLQLSAVWPYRGFLSDPDDGVAVVTTVPSTPFWLWPRSAGKPERSYCFGFLFCPKLTVVFSPEAQYISKRGLVQHVLEDEREDFEKHGFLGTNHAPSLAHTSGRGR